MDAVTPAELRGRRVLVLGLGAFGGGAGCARALAGLGARVTVSDLRDREQLSEAVEALAGLDLEWALGGHHGGLFEDAEVVVVNPAVPLGSPWLEVARATGCRLTTEVNLALAACAATPTFAVTGTHGKSTCAAFAAHLLEGLPGRTVLAGNLGGSLLERTAGLGPGDRLVVELSSFQTEALVAPPGWPRVAALTCLGSDHLDRHGDLEHYAAAKRRLLAFQDTDGEVLLPANDPEAAHWAAAARGRVQRLDASILEEAGLTVHDLPFDEPYRLPSLYAAIAAARRLGAPAGAALAERARAFVGLPHRMQPIGGLRGLRVIDNGVATHPEPTEAALRHMQDDAIVLLAGGKDKGLPLDGLAEAATRCVRIHLYGQGGARLAESCAARGLETRLYAGVRAAASAALDTLGEAETLLFSPSFSSYDEFRNFRDRAECFRAMCHARAAARESRDIGPIPD